MNHRPVPVLNITDNPDDLWTNMTIHFTSVGSYDIDGEGRITFSWDFDDGSDPSTLANPTHVYALPGIYAVTLTVIDAKEVTASASKDIIIQRNYGDSDIVIKAVEHNTQKTFIDPNPETGESQAAVMRDGWVAYVMDIRKGDKVSVKVTVLGDRPADVYLLNEVNFQTYRKNPQVTFVFFEGDGYKKGLKADAFAYSWTPRTPDRYYVVIDNKDWPIGTDTAGPVDYTISVDPQWEIDQGGPLPGASAVMSLAAIGAVAAVAVIVRRRER
jgi:PKD repeat protein